MLDFNALVDKQRIFFETGETKEIPYRLRALDSLTHMIRFHEQELMNALKQDLNKNEFDAYTTEIGSVLSEIQFVRKRLEDWARPSKVKSSLLQFGSRSYIYSEPYGVALIVSPWNYPLQLVIAPLIGAIAAGNCAVIKTSEYAPNTSKLLARIIALTYKDSYITVVEGGVEESQALLKERFDTIFFTGSTTVGKSVMQSAAEHLTPVTLELGGKSPCIVHKDANLTLAAKRIAWGKYLNAGQTCVAPDYVYVHADIKEEFISSLQDVLPELYSEDVFQDRSFTRIVNEQHFDRLLSFLEEGKTSYGGRHDRDSLTIEPTVLADITWNDAVMQEEVFGPILPILVYSDESSMIEQINLTPKPLALYLFSETEQLQDRVLNQISFGGGCINDTVYHLTSPYLPFGGIGASGMGAYHGKSSFDTFSHKKSILKQTTTFDLPMRYGKGKNPMRWIRRLLR